MAKTSGAKNEVMYAKATEWLQSHGYNQGEGGVWQDRDAHTANLQDVLVQFMEDNAAYTE